MKKTQLFYLPLLAMISFFMVSCAGEPKEEVKEDGINIDIDGEDGKTNLKIGEDGIKINVNGKESSINIDMKDLEEGMNKLFDGKKVPVVNFRAFKKLMPAEVVGLKRTSLEGSKSGFGGLKVAISTAEYGEGETKIKISIIDTGGMGMAAASLAGWTDIEVDSESDHGYEKTTIIDGHKAFVSYDSEDKEGKIAIFAKDRVLYSIEIENGTEAMLKKAQNAVDLDDIIDLVEDVEE